MSSGYYYWYLQKFSPISTSFAISPFYNRLKENDINPESGAHTLVFAGGNSGILMSGSFLGSSKTTSWSIGFAYIDATTGNIKYIYAA
jgi:hypothetical protein